MSGGRKKKKTYIEAISPKDAAVAKDPRIATRE